MSLPVLLTNALLVGGPSHGQVVGVQIDWQTVRVPYVKLGLQRGVESNVYTRRHLVDNKMIFVIDGMTDTVAQILYKASGL